MNSADHDKLRSNTIATLEKKLGGQPFRVLSQGESLLPPGSNQALTPDLAVVANDAVANTDGVYTDAVIVVEVMSAESEEADRGEKFRLYQTLPSLKEYLLLCHHDVQVDHYHHPPNNEWALNEVCGREWEFVLKGVRGMVKVSDLYEGVELDEAYPAKDGPVDINHPFRAE